MSTNPSDVLTCKWSDRTDKKLSHYSHYITMPATASFKWLEIPPVFVVVWKPPWPPAWLGVGLRVAEVSPGIITFSWYSLWATLQHSNTPGLHCVRPGLPRSLVPTEINPSPVVPTRTDSSLADWASIRNIQILIGRLALPCSALRWPPPLLASWGSTLSTSFVQLALRSFYWTESEEKQTVRGN